MYSADLKCKYSVFLSTTPFSFQRKQTGLTGRRGGRSGGLGGGAVGDGMGGCNVEAAVG